MSQQTFRVPVVYVAGERPPFIPEGWKVYSAPRPLWGTVEVECVGDKLRGLSPCGKFLVAINPQDALADRMEAKCVRDGGSLVVYWSVEAAEKWGRDRLVADYGAEAVAELDVEEWGKRQFLQTWADEYPAQAGLYREVLVNV